MKVSYSNLKEKQTCRLIVSNNIVEWTNFHVLFRFMKILLMNPKSINPMSMKQYVRSLPQLLSVILFVLSVSNIFEMK